MKCPLLTPLLIITDEPKLAAHLSCALARRGHYLPIVDGPRLQRADASAEIVRRNNAAARADSQVILLAGLNDQTIDALKEKYPNNPFAIVCEAADIEALTDAQIPTGEPILWGRDRIGVGLLTALRAGSSIKFKDIDSPTNDMQPESEHLVVCEQGEELSEVIAANYAFAIGAGLFLIPQVGDEKSASLLEDLYSLHDGSGSPKDQLEKVKQELRALCGTLPIQECTSITFISAKLPFGFAYAEVPSTHLFSYPDLGIAIINGFAAEQPKTRGVNIAVLVDPGTAEAPEINDVAAALASNDTLVRVYRGANADVTSISEAMEHFPYDLLFFATHCGDATGYLRTYEFLDSEGHQRTLILEVTPGIGRSNDPDQFKVTEYMRFHSLDGEDWNDSEAKARLYVGTAIIDWTKLVRDENLQPTKREVIERVRGSAVLRMYDNNLVVMQQHLAHLGTPIIVTNACVSWHELASRLIFQNARAYVGTLFPVLTSEAHSIATEFLDNHYGKPLAEALWHAQNSAYGSSTRRPYVLSGVYPQALRSTPENKMDRIHKLLSDGQRKWQSMLEQYELNKDDYATREARDVVRYFSREAKAALSIEDQSKAIKSTD